MAGGPRLALAVHQSRNVIGLAVAGSQAIRTTTRATVWVTPVIVVWADFTQVVGQTRAGSFVSALSRGGSRIKLARIAPGRVEQIAEAVGATLAGLDVTRQSSGSVRP